jgi:hypothetical protein
VWPASAPLPLGARARLYLCSQTGSQTNHFEKKKGKKRRKKKKENEEDSRNKT